MKSKVRSEITNGVDCKDAKVIKDIETKGKEGDAEST